MTGFVQNCGTDLSMTTAPPAARILLVLRRLGALLMCFDILPPKVRDRRSFAALAQFLVQYYSSIFRQIACDKLRKSGADGFRLNPPGFLPTRRTCLSEVTARPARNLKDVISPTVESSFPAVRNTLRTVPGTLRPDQRACFDPSRNNGFQPCNKDPDLCLHAKKS